ncbi:MAG: hypothetical protein EA350_05395 [Gemmatimonadales bacterium]|nr:MAG: hypothetical protein EA350_05395 [Gemmatimonadales bacterium]
MQRMTEERQSSKAVYSESRGDLSELRELQTRRTSVVLLGLCAAAMLIDLLPPLAHFSGLYVRSYFLGIWFLTVGLVLNGAVLVLLPIGIYLARRSASGAVMTGLVFYLVSTTVGLFILKMLTYWAINLRTGRHLNEWLFVSVFAVGASSLWAWRRAKTSGTAFWPAYFLIALLCGIALTEFAVWGVRNLG